MPRLYLTVSAVPPGGSRPHANARVAVLADGPDIVGFRARGREPRRYLMRWIVYSLIWR